MRVIGKVLDRAMDAVFSLRFACGAYFGIGLFHYVLWTQVTNVSVLFALFLLPGWPLWYVALLTDNMALASWLPGGFWTRR